MRNAPLPGPRHLPSTIINSGSTLFIAQETLKQILDIIHIGGTYSLPFGTGSQREGEEMAWRRPGAF